MAVRQSKGCTNPPMPPEGVETVRCTMCNKPLEKAKAAKVASSWFCCDEAARTHFESNSTVSAHNVHQAKMKRKALIKNLVILVILGVIGAGGYVYWSNNKEKVNGQLQSVVNTVKGWTGKASTAVDNAAEDAKKSVNEKIPDKVERAQDPNIIE